jgi:hypothetical protein
MRGPSGALTQRPCPECDYAMVQLDRCRDVCPRDGSIVVNEARAYLWVRRVFRAREVLLVERA